MAAKRGVKMQMASSHSIGAMGRPVRAKGKGKPGKRGAAAIPGKAVAKGPGGK